MRITQSEVDEILAGNSKELIERLVEPCKRLALKFAVYTGAMYLKEDFEGVALATMVHAVGKFQEHPKSTNPGALASYIQKSVKRRMSRFLDYERSQGKKPLMECETDFEFDEFTSPGICEEREAYRLHELEIDIQDTFETRVSPDDEPILRELFHGASKRELIRRGVPRRQLDATMARAKEAFREFNMTTKTTERLGILINQLADEAPQNPSALKYVLLAEAIITPFAGVDMDRELAEKFLEICEHLIQLGEVVKAA